MAKGHRMFWDILNPILAQRLLLLEQHAILVDIVTFIGIFAYSFGPMLQMFKVYKEQDAKAIESKSVSIYFWGNLIGLILSLTTNRIGFVLGQAWFVLVTFAQYIYIRNVKRREKTAAIT